MRIQFLEDQALFVLNTPNTSYVMALVGEEKFLCHAYYGQKIADTAGIAMQLRLDTDPQGRDRLSFLDAAPMEYGSHGIGDFRESSARIINEAGQDGTLFTYVSHEILSGKPALEGLPATFGDAESAETLWITCMDKTNGLRAILSYSVFSDTDAVARSVKFINDSTNCVYLEKAMSACLDMDNKDFETLTLHGSWARERHMDRKKLGKGIFAIGMERGGNCAQEHPFMALVNKHCTYEQGEAYGFSFVYSGNYLFQAQVSQFDSVRVQVGINPQNFKWKLEAGASFQTPEVVMVYSAKGLNAMSLAFHDVYRNHLIRSPYLHKKRPILINNWEATYFDFDTEKLIDIAKESAKLGIEMLVMDDGWFGNRYDDNRALGDWFVNEEKLQGGLKYLVDEVNKLGMKFGIWFEPEMISPESKLYEEHPDWALAFKGRTPGLARNQYVLDLTRKEVRDYVMDMVLKVMHSANIEYVKWDMNRPLSDVGSMALPADEQGEIFHRYVLGLYEMQQRLLDEFPNLLLENCSGGGGRFDAGMLYFSPQIWCSDDTDAIERLAIQEGTALVYPLCCMGAHVSVCPNHTVGRVTPFETRGHVALAGTFGYELDITKLSKEDKALVPKQVALYHAFNDLVREGDYTRIASYQENGAYDAFMVADKDKSKALVWYVHVLARANQKDKILPLSGLDENKMYRLSTVNMELENPLVQTDKIYSGSVLKKAGFAFEKVWGDFKAQLLYFEEV